MAFPSNHDLQMLAIGALIASDELRNTLLSKTIPGDATPEWRLLEVIARDPDTRLAFIRSKRGDFQGEDGDPVKILMRGLMRIEVETRLKQAVTRYSMYARQHDMAAEADLAVSVSEGLRKLSASLTE